MEIVPITQTYWSDTKGEMVETGNIIAYEALDARGNVIGRGETVAEALEDALRIPWLAAKGT